MVTFSNVCVKLQTSKDQLRLSKFILSIPVFLGLILGQVERAIPFFEIFSATNFLNCFPTLFSISLFLRGHCWREWRQSVEASGRQSSRRARRRPPWRGGGGSRTPWSAACFDRYSEWSDDIITEPKIALEDILKEPKIALGDTQKKQKISEVWEPAEKLLPSFGGLLITDNLPK